MLLWKKAFKDISVFGSLMRPNRKIFVPAMGNAKVGATAGWVITAGTDKAHATLPGTPTTNSTLIINLSGFLQPGDRLKGVSLVGQAESAGNNVAMTLSLRRTYAAAADNVDAELGTVSTGNLTADTLFTVNNTGIYLPGTSGSNGEVVQADSVYYLKITGSAATLTDIDLLGVLVEVDQA